MSEPKWPIDEPRLQRIEASLRDGSLGIDDSLREILLEVCSLARAALAQREREREGQEAITEEWLATIGKHHDGLDCYVYEIRAGAERLEIDVPLIGPEVWQVFIAMRKSNYRIHLAEFTTRGQLRRLLEALGGGK